jgi:hypothetical protein
VRLFKNASAIKTELVQSLEEGGVVEVKPDLAIVKKYNIATGQVTEQRRVSSLVVVVFVVFDVF